MLEKSVRGYGVLSLKRVLVPVRRDDVGVLNEAGKEEEGGRSSWWWVEEIYAYTQVERDCGCVLVSTLMASGSGGFAELKFEKLTSWQ